MRTDILDAFLADLAGLQGAPANTVMNYRRHVSRLLAFLDTRGVGVDGITARLLSDFTMHLSESGMAWASTRAIVGASRSFLLWLCGQGVVDALPVDGFGKLPKIDGNLPRILTPAEAWRLVRAWSRFRSPMAIRNECIMRVLYCGGLRASEVCSLDVSSLHMACLNVYGKGDKERIVPIGWPAARQLRHYLRLARPRLAHDTGDGALFLSRFGDRMERSAIFDIVKCAARRTGFEEARIWPHLLRHTCASHLLSGGMDLICLRDFLGHESLSSTQIYTHVAIDRLIAVHRACHPRGKVEDTDGQAPAPKPRREWRPRRQRCVSRPRPPDPAHNARMQDYIERMKAMEHARRQTPKFKAWAAGYREKRRAKVSAG